MLHKLRPFTEILAAPTETVLSAHIWNERNDTQLTSSEEVGSGKTQRGDFLSSERELEHHPQRFTSLSFSPGDCRSCSVFLHISKRDRITQRRNSDIRPLQADAQPHAAQCKDN